MGLGQRGLAFDDSVSQYRCMGNINHSALLNKYFSLHHKRQTNKYIRIIYMICITYSISYFPTICCCNDTCTHCSCFGLGNRAKGFELPFKK